MDLSTADVVAAISEVAQLVERTQRRLVTDTRAAVETIAALVDRRAPQLAATARQRLEAAREHDRIEVLEPHTLPWDPFELFGNQYRETAWTQWLASCLRAEHGATLAHVTWRALCECVMNAVHPPTEDDEQIATVADWQTARTVLPRRVIDELREPEGQPDIVVYAAPFVAVLENKLWASWHDRGAHTQASSYERLAQRLAKTQSTKRALVLLTCRPQMRAPAPWVVITYAMLASRLRREVRDALGSDSSVPEIAQMMPALLTVRAIERHLLDRPTLSPEGDPLDVVLAAIRYEREREGWT